MPLAHGPGEAQVDFGIAEVMLDGQAATVALFVMTLPYSDATFACVFARECTEAFLEGHVRAFAFFGGVPRRIAIQGQSHGLSRIPPTHAPQELPDKLTPLAREGGPVDAAVNHLVE